MAALLHPLGAGRQIAVDRAVILIGRSAECDVVLDCSSRISRIHCAIVQVDSDYYLRDLGSMNGVWVGSQRIVRDQKLQNGVEVSIGDLRFLFLDNVTVVPKQPLTQASGTNAPVKVTVQPANTDTESRPVVPAVERTESSRGVSASETTLRQSSLQNLNEAGDDLTANAGMVPNVSSEIIIQASANEYFEDVEVLCDDDELAPVIFSDLELIEDVELIDDDDIELIDDEDVELIEDVEIVETPSHTVRNLRKNN